MKKTLSILTLLTFLFVTACETAETNQVKVPENSGETMEAIESLSVITSFYPLYYFTSEVVGELYSVEVTNLLSTGGEPHTYEPSPSQLADLESADLVIVQGAGLEPWLDGLEHSLEDAGAHILNVNSRLDLFAYEEDEHDDEDEHEEDEDEHDDEDGHEDEDGHDDEDEHEDEDDDHAHGEYDPHTWLDPVLAQEIVEMIAEELVEHDPSNEAVYTANAADLLDRLDELDHHFEDELALCSLDAIMTSHDAFSYLANRYGLHAYPVAGVSPFDEPSANQLIELIELAEDEGLEHIYFEVLANPEIAEVLAAEAGLTPLVLDPLAGLSSEQTEEDYISIMESNLENLKTGLACE